MNEMKLTISLKEIEAESITSHHILYNSAALEMA